jgi:predicted small integral membrane protein
MKPSKKKTTHVSEASLRNTEAKDAPKNLELGSPPSVLEPKSAPFWMTFAMGLGLSVFFAWLCFRFVALEKGAIYLSDFATYWSQVVSIANDIRARGITLDLLKVLYESVGKNHYNFLPSVPLVPFQFLGFGSRASFIGATAFVFLGPAAYACGRLVIPHLHTRYSNLIALLCGGLAMVSTCTIWWPIYRGYVDASALACALGCVAVLYQRERPEQYLRRAILAGFLLGLSVVLRAYFAFYAIAFCLLLTVDSLVKFFRATDGSAKKEQFKFLCAFALGAAANAAVFPKFVALSMSMDHGIHAAFLSGRTFWEDIWYLCTYFGGVFLLLTVLSVICYVRALGFRSPLWVPSGASVLGGLLFMRDQFFGEHHRFLLLVGALSSIMLALGVSLGKPRSRLHFAFLTLFLLSCIGCLSDLHGAGSPGVFNGMSSPEPVSGEPATRSKAWTAAFGFAAPRPMIRTDREELARMYAFLDGLIARDPNARIYVLASGLSLSDMVIYASLLPSPNLEFRAARNLLPVHQVDSRDGPPSNLLAASYVLTSETLETHLRPGTQKCVEVPWRQFNEERGYARGFEKMSERFHLERGVEALVFKRTRPSFPLEVKELEKDLREAGLLK